MLTVDIRGTAMCALGPLFGQGLVFEPRKGPKTPSHGEAMWDPRRVSEKKLVRERASKLPLFTQSLRQVEHTLSIPDEASDLAAQWRS